MKNQSSLILVILLCFLFSSSTSESEILCDKIYNINKRIGSYNVNVQVCHNEAYQDCYIYGTVVYRKKGNKKKIKLLRPDIKHKNGYVRMEWLALNNSRGFKLYYYPKTREVKFDRAYTKKGKWKWKGRQYWFKLPK